jgi:hypothetical protein
MEAPVIVYKTKADYISNVPVLMDSKKEIIISYPDPVDVFYNGELAIPTRLIDGYLLDNRGIGVNSVFTSFTYEEYSKLKQVPGIETLKRSIMDKDPILEMYNCGSRSNFKKKLDQLIKSNFAGCKRLK